MCKTGWLGWLLFAGVLGGPMVARAATASQAPRNDREFVEKALAINGEEVQLGRLATERASTPEVKAMGEKMVQNHTRLGQQLGDLGAPLGVSGAPAPSPEQRETSRCSGSRGLRRHPPSSARPSTACGRCRRASSTPRSSGRWTSCTRGSSR
jgi:hypothetical protein